MVVCSKCGKEIVKPEHVGTGYGRDKDNNIICYECCGKIDADQLENLPIGGRMMLYLVKRDDGLYYVTNWPGTLKIKCTVRKGYHNIAGTRYDVWFTFNGKHFYGVTYGDNTEICHVKRIKGGF